VIRRGIDFVSHLIIPREVLRTGFAKRGFGCKPLVLRWIGKFFRPVTGGAQRVGCPRRCPVVPSNSDEEISKSEGTQE
jgi:hypothetical protein